MRTVEVLEGSRRHELALSLERAREAYRLRPSPQNAELCERLYTELIDGEAETR